MATPESEVDQEQVAEMLTELERDIEESLTEHGVARIAIEDVREMIAVARRDLVVWFEVRDAPI